MSSNSFGVQLARSTLENGKLHLKASAVICVFVRLHHSLSLFLQLSLSFKKSKHRSNCEGTLGGRPKKNLTLYLKGNLFQMRAALFFEFTFSHTHRN